jgi:hypothetical protein
VGNHGEGDVQTVVIPDGEIDTIRLYHGAAVDGIQIVMRHGESVLFGQAKGAPGEVKFHPGERLVGLYVKHGYYVDSASLITDRRRTQSFGGSGGGPTELIPPFGYRLRGFTGSFRVSFSAARFCSIAS